RLDAISSAVFSRNDRSPRTRFAKLGADSIFFGLENIAVAMPGASGVEMALLSERPVSLAAWLPTESSRSPPFYGRRGLVSALRHRAPGGAAMSFRRGAVLALVLLLLPPAAALAQQEMSSAPRHIEAVRAFLTGWGHESWDEMRPLAADSITVRLGDQT